MIFQILLFDQPRSAAQLLRRIVSKQPKLEIRDNSFGRARGCQVQWLMGETWADGMSDGLQTLFDLGVQGECKNGGRLSKMPKRSIPDDLLFAPGTLPVLTIRDPRLTVSSTYRVLAAMGLPHGSGRPNFLISTSTLWIRRLYEAYRSRGIEPVVVDADDLMTSPEFARHVCAKLGLDPESACLSWEATSAEEKAKLHPMEYASQKFLIDSTGIDESRAAKNQDMEAQVQGWPAEFGEDVELVREMVDLAMPHYQYLYERRFEF
ncbi:protein-S-isoprenylcysteine O-methyltransferase [Apiospora arundinis]